MELTLNVSNGLLEDLLEDLGALELLLDLSDQGLSKLLLLALLDLALVANPRVEDRLSLGSEGGALLELVGLSLKLGGFLQHSNLESRKFVDYFAYPIPVIPWKQRREPWCTQQPRSSG